MLAANRIAARAFGGVALFYFGQIVARSISFGYIFLLARMLPAQTFGELSLVLSILVIADTLADLGLSRLAMREMARDSSCIADHLGRLVILKLAMALAAYGLVLAILGTGGSSGEVLAMAAVAGLGLGPMGLSMLIEMGLHVRQRFGYVAIAHLGLGLAQAGMGLGALSIGGGGVAIAGTTVIANAIYLVLILKGLADLGLRIVPTVAPSFWKAALREAWPFGVMAVLLIVGMRCELLVIGWLGSGNDLAAYGIVAKLNDAALLAPITLSTVLAPTFARYFTASPDRLTVVYSQTVRYGLLAAVPCALFGAKLGGPLVRLMLNDRYPEVDTLLPVVFAGFPAAALNLVNIGLMLSADRQARTLALVTALLVVQILAAAFLVRAAGAQGAAQSFLITSCGAAFASTLLLHRWFLRSDMILQAFAPAVVAGLGLVAVLALRGSGTMTGALPGLAVYASLAIFAARLTPLPPGAGAAPAADPAPAGSP